MIEESTLVQVLQAAFEGAEVAVMDKTGMMDHYRVYVGWSGFTGKNLIQQHQLIYQVLNPLIQAGQLHAVELKTEVLTPLDINP